MDIGKHLITVGLLLVFAGIFFTLSNKISFLSSFGKLFGDYTYRTDNLKIYFPFMSMIILSFVVTILLNLFNRFFK
jgi:peptidoglycan biosynthesis protein MviN/MurJ (putative lipid II flippase)